MTYLADILAYLKHLHELLKRHLAIIVEVHLLNHVLQHIIRKVRIVNFEELSQLILRDNAIIIDIKEIERLHNHIEVLLLLPRRHEQLATCLHRHELTVVNRVILVLICLLDDILDLHEFAIGRCIRIVTLIIIIIIILVRQIYLRHKIIQLISIDLSVLVPINLNEHLPQILQLILIHICGHLHKGHLPEQRIRIIRPLFKLSHQCL